MKELPPFYVGQRVICINDNIDSGIPGMLNNGLKELIKNNIYTIIELNPSYIEGWLCWLKEAPIDRNWRGFHCSRFAPIEENFQHITYKAVLEKEEKLIGVN